VLRTVAKKLAREMIKRQVPKKVFEDCADIINRRFLIDDDRLAKHEKWLEETARRLPRRSTNRNSRVSQS